MMPADGAPVTSTLPMARYQPSFDNEEALIMHAQSPIKLVNSKLISNAASAVQHSDWAVAGRTGLVLGIFDHSSVWCWQLAPVAVAD